MAELLTNDLRGEFLKAFNLFDINGEGAIPTGKLESVLKILDVRYTERELHRLIATIDADASGKIDAAEFMELMAEIMRDRDSEEEINAAFRPVDDDMNGTVSVTALLECIATPPAESSRQASLGVDAASRHAVSIEQLREYLRHSGIAITQDDKINYASFISTMLMRAVGRDAGSKES